MLPVVYPGRRKEPMKKLGLAKPPAAVIEESVPFEESVVFTFPCLSANQSLDGLLLFGSDSVPLLISDHVHEVLAT